MRQYAVYIEQVNQERIIVGAKSPLDARRKALEIWRSNYSCPLIIDVMELPNEDLIDYATKSPDDRMA